MNQQLCQAVDNFTTFLKNSKVNINLEGWPAAACIITGCITGAVTFCFKVAHQNSSKPG